MLIEVIGTSLSDVLDAEKYHADRVELCQSMMESGLTPSYGLIKSAVEAVDIPINVMVRPHSNSFVYDEHDFKIMREDIRAIKSLGANGIVIGSLTDRGTVDEDVLQRLLDEADGLKVTFHRAFDFVRDQKEALETILTYEQITTILTAGGDGTASEFVENLVELHDRTKDTHLTIMPGNGLRVDELKPFYQAIQPKALHFGTGIRIDQAYANGISEEQIKKIREITC
ncbi:copper homeostasis protein CutC [Pseudogracilibacillus auburnensis]|uniref:PF03932 family protein CutC n=1 Tax=Pseudogracilibacillus auburnensis TaxID=1494959 RepID=A0A2V3VR79_9BACI|nr:copper homeostasis protein CutC [Pseudogracilibacillus auburnensis]PXW83331.1 copper homeostasis protein CutC [Pseudogracilibacillus auburnensis]